MHIVLRLASVELWMVLGSSIFKVLYHFCRVSNLHAQYPDCWLPLLRCRKHTLPMTRTVQ